MKKLVELWQVTSADYRIRLFVEFILMPQAFEARYQNEIAFQCQLKNGWR